MHKPCFIALAEVVDGETPDPPLLLNVEFVANHCQTIRSVLDKGVERSVLVFPAGIDDIHVRETLPEIELKIAEVTGDGQQDG
jgi:hypothetical protein